MNNINQDRIIFLSSIHRDWAVDKSEKYHYHNLYELNLENITNFLSMIRNEDIMLISPFVTYTKKISDPYLILSEQFLVNKNSKPEIIFDFMFDQWSQSNFGNEIDNQSLFFYFKLIWPRFKSKWNRLKNLQAKVYRIKK